MVDPSSSCDSQTAILSGEIYLQLEEEREEEEERKKKKKKRKKGHNCWFLALGSSGDKHGEKKCWHLKRADGSSLAANLFLGGGSLDLFPVLTESSREAWQPKNVVVVCLKDRAGTSHRHAGTNDRR